MYRKTGILYISASVLDTVCALARRDKVSENAPLMQQLANNSAEQAMLGDFSKAVDDAVLYSNEAHKNQMLQLLADPAKAKGFAKLAFELLQRGDG